MSAIEKHASASYDLVIVGASAGGVEALSILVSTLPASFPVPIVLAQHLDPNRPSSLNLILQRRTNLPVEVVNTTSQLLPGTIYVVPSNRQVSIKDHHVEVHEDRNKRLRPSVDALFSTAAEEYGDRLIAVILTGSGSDGAIGAVDVKNAGGTIIVQDPQSARYPSMPLSLPPTIIDFEVSIEQLGGLLSDLLSGIDIPQTEEKTENILHEILTQVSRQAIIDFRAYKTSTILRRIGRRMAVTHCHTIREYADYLKMYPEEIGDLVKAFLINVTQFFRDSEAFAYLKEEILPKMIADARAHDRILRFWTAGCATGEEPYSLAMLLTDLLGAEIPEWSIKIFATDVDEATINFARRGLYSENLLKGIPSDYRDRFFERVDQGYRISKTLRQMVIFGEQDLSRSAPFPRINLLVCRNVLIYFTPDLQDYVLNQFAFSLCPDGYLFLGKAETVRSTQAFYDLVSKHWKVYRCTGNPLPSVRRQAYLDPGTTNIEDASMSHTHRNRRKTHADLELSTSSFEIGQLKHFNELLLRFLPVGVIVIDRFYRVLTSNGVARRLLGLRDITSEHDFLHAVRGIPYQVTRSAIDTVFRERNAVSLPEVELEVQSGGNGRFVSLAMALMPGEVGAAEMATISITDVTEQVQTRRQLETAQLEQTQLMGELSATNKRLSDVNKELLDANEELQIANEELMLTHEELQASIEEFETTNEELQATNEELETNNEELQATNEELETTNDELRARTSEQQELATILESERIRLAEMVELAPFYILVLHGPDLTVDAYNPRYAPLLNSENVQGRPLAEVNNFFWEEGVGGRVILLAREVYIHNDVRTLQRVFTHLPLEVLPTDTQRLHSTAKRYFTYTIVPSHDANRRVNGVIIYAVDETERQQIENQEELQQITAIFENTAASILALYDAQTSKLIIGTSSYLEIMAPTTEAGALAGKTWSEINSDTLGEKALQIWNNILQCKEPVRISEVVHLSGENKSSSHWHYIFTPFMHKEKPDDVHFVLVSIVDMTDHIEQR